MLLSTLSLSAAVRGEDFNFDPATYKGYSFAQNIEQFNHSNVVPGEYLVDIFLNDKLILSGAHITFRFTGKDQSAQPCFNSDIAKKMRLTLRSLSPVVMQCRPLTYWASTAKWEFDQAALRLRLTIPESDINRRPRGYIPESEWDAGISALFIRHNTNYLWTENQTSNFRYEYLWSGITSGFNVSDWQLRHQSNLRLIRSQRKRSFHYDAVRSWIEHPVAALTSRVYLGDNSTDSSQFGSLPFNGFKITTDERMRPQSKRGYAPEIHGIASTNARVVVKQLDHIVYETMVPPGPFVIDDLYNTRNQGDFEVQVIEANGKKAIYTVPYASVPDSMRPGSWHYSLSLGRVRQFYAVNNGFFEGIVQHGLSNNLTATAGSRLAQDYYAWLMGGVWATGLGAVGLNTTISQAKVTNDERTSGWRAELSYSKTFDTGTNLVLAAYRYSTRGFRDLEDVLGVRRQHKAGINYYSDTLNQRNRLSMTLSQSMNDLGLLSLSASTADYYNNQSRITQLQLGYSNNWRGISYGLNLARQRTYWNNRRFNLMVDNDSDSSRHQKYTENTLSLNISIPLSWGAGFSSVAYNYNQSRQSQSSTVSLTGSAGKQHDFSYSLYGGTDHYKNGDSSRASSFGGNLQQNTRYGAMRANYGQGSDYRQLGLGTSGTLLIHRGGVTAGPYTSDTFALVHAQGAEGALVQNGQGAVIDSNGYALLPSLTPYQENSVSLDTLHMRSDTELSAGSQRIVPYAGAVGRITFPTLRGKAVLIAIKNGAAPPMGAEVRDSDGTLIGLVGQGSQLYARVPHDSGTLKVSWNGNTSQCLVDYQITGMVPQELVQLESICRKL